MVDYCTNSILEFLKARGNDGSAIGPIYIGCQTKTTYRDFTSLVLDEMVADGSIFKVKGRYFIAGSHPRSIQKKHNSSKRVKDIFLFDANGSLLEIFHDSKSAADFMGVKPPYVCNAILNGMLVRGKWLVSYTQSPPDNRSRNRANSMGKKPNRWVVDLSAGYVRSCIGKESRSLPDIDSIIETKRVLMALKRFTSQKGRKWKSIRR